ncbi:hypothetical protein F7725_021774 [Dissostichus mawsoni]|uniref:Uncharacterized protein n=1 Tax=Dissostichus mawsoni TaxID=36200 RepID=A0A7J5ZC64_DISMA|nr:hypothetical protein F7725_021774 [Dissostichus mawsoni]
MEMKIGELSVEGDLDTLYLVAQFDGGAELQVHALLYGGQSEQQQRLAVNVLQEEIHSYLKRQFKSMSVWTSCGPRGPRSPRSFPCAEGPAQRGGAAGPAAVHLHRGAVRVVLTGSELVPSLPDCNIAFLFFLRRVGLASVASSPAIGLESFLFFP